MPNIQVAFDNIVHAHRVVRDTTNQILASRDPEDVAARLHELADVLPRHFQVEEREHGFFDHLRRRVRDAEASIARLVDDHRVMEVSLADLIAAEIRDDAWLLAARKFVQHLREHEQVEARLGASPEIDDDAL